MININVGVLGHVDSGKTSLCKCLSEVLSTCALDKHKQSAERGITIDLGFSSFYIKKKKNSNSYIDNSEYIPSNSKNNGEHANFDKNKNFPSDEIVQICLVDCPGHHSLLKCIVMGVEITDIIFLVIDINKGIQNQTIECLVLCEIVKSDIIIILNKIDTIPIDVREKKINLMKKKLKDALNRTRIKDLRYYIISIAAENKNNENTDYENQSLCNEKWNENFINEGKNVEAHKREESDSLQITCELEKINGNESNKNINDIQLEEKREDFLCKKQDIYAIKEEPNSNKKKKQQNQYNDEKAPKYKKGLNIKSLIDLLTDIIQIPVREISTYKEFYFLYDHSFEIKGKGTVFTGTVIKGMIKNNCNITILPINESGKVKEIQSFKKKVEEGTKGNRLSLLISNYNVKNKNKIERGIIVHEHSNISHFSMFICKVNLVEFYKKNVSNGELLTCIIGFSSSLCYGFFFKKIDSLYSKINRLSNFDIPLKQGLNKPLTNDESQRFDVNGNYLLVNGLCAVNEVRELEAQEGEAYFLVVLKKNIYCFKNEKCIFLKNDDNINCRICLYANILDIVDDNHCKNNLFIVNKKPDLNQFENYKNLKILKEKEKIGLIDKVLDNNNIICKNMFNFCGQINTYLNKKIYIVDSCYQTNKNELKIQHIGNIVKSFGKNGKFIVQFDEDISYFSEHYKSFIVLIKYYKDIFRKKKIFL